MIKRVNMLGHERKEEEVSVIPPAFTFSSLISMFRWKRYPSVVTSDTKHTPYVSMGATVSPLML